MSVGSCFVKKSVRQFVPPIWWDFLADLRGGVPDASRGAVCDLCVRSARPSSFFRRHSSSTSSSTPQSVDSALQVPAGPLVVSGAAMSLATESVESGVVEPSACVAESSTAATRSTTGNHQIDYCKTALVADQSHRICCTPTEHTVRREWEACVQDSFGCISEPQGLLHTLRAHSET